MTTQANQIGLQHFRVLGIDRSSNTGVYMLNDNSVVYFSGNNIVSHNLENRDQRFLPYTDTSRGDVKSVAITPNTLTGVALLAFSLELDASIIYLVDVMNWKRLKPITLPSSFTTMSFTALAFSSNGKFLIAQGNTDSLLFYFDVSNGNLLGSHKVTAGPTTGPMNSVVTCISFNPTDHNSICCSGKGIFRQLTRSDKGFTVKQGPTTNRDSMDFKSHIWVGDGRIITSTADGHLHCVEGPNVMMQLNLKNTSGTAPTHLTPTPKGFVCVTGGNQVHFFEKQTDSRQYTESSTIIVDENTTISALSVSQADERIIALMSDARLIGIPLVSSNDVSGSQQDMITTIIPPHHIGAITAIDVAFRKQLLVTCGEDHAIRVWNYEKMTCENTHFFADQPLSVSFHPNGFSVLAGFPEKVRFMAITVNDLVTQREFPIRNCKELKFSHGGQYFACVNGNNVQIYSSYTFKNLVNLRSPGQRVVAIAWSTDDNVLVSCDMNGAMIIHTVRTGKQKASSAAQQNFHYSSIVCTDAVGTRCYGITAPDNTLRETEDTSTKASLDIVAVPCQICLGPSNRCLFVSTRNGTIRIYHFPGASNTGMNFPSADTMTEIVAHHAPVTSLVTAPDYQYLFSAGEDGCVYMFKINGVDTQSIRADSKIIYSEDVLISRMELVEQLKKLRKAQQEVTELNEEHQRKLNAQEEGFKEKLKEIKEKFHADEKNEEAKISAETNEIEAMRSDAQAQNQNGVEGFMKEEKQRKERFEKNMKNEEEQKAQLEKEIELARKKWENELDLLIEENRKKREQIKILNEKSIEELKKKETVINQEKALMIQEFDQWEASESKKLMFELGKLEFEALRQRERESGLNKELEKRHNELDSQVKKSTDGLSESLGLVNSKREEVKSLQEKIAELTNDQGLKNGHLSELQYNIRKKDDEINELIRKNADAEKTKQLEENRINDLKKTIEPKNARKQDILVTYDRMQQEMQRYTKNDEQLQLETDELRLKIEAKKKEIESRTTELEEVKQMTRQFKLEVHQVYQLLLGDETKEIKKRKGFAPALADLYRKYVGDESTSMKKNTVTDIQIERNRERDALERNITAVARRINRGDEEHTRQHSRMMEENVTLMTQISELNRQNQNLLKRKMLLEESSKSAYTAEELHKILEMQNDRIGQLTEQLKQLQLRGNVSRRHPISRERLPPINP